MAIVNHSFELGDVVQLKGHTKVMVVNDAKPFEIECIYECNDSYVKQPFKPEVLVKVPGCTPPPITAPSRNRGYTA